MSVWEAILLGIVEGLTEYLPVSSTGHLILTQRLLGLPETEASNAYAICIQAGAIVAVLGIYRQRMLQMSQGLWHLGKGSADAQSGLRLAANLIVAFLPAAVFGSLFDDKIEEILFSLWYTVVAWFLGGVAILIVSYHRRRRERQRVGLYLEDLTWQGALAIGLIQCVAMWPGTSRSLVTIVGGIQVGLTLTAAVEFSFLLGVITLLAATVYKLKDAGPTMLESYSWSVMIIGSIAAWLSAVVAVKWMVSYLKRRGMELFGYYRVGLAAIVAILLWQQRISA